MSLVSFLTIFNSACLQIRSSRMMKSTGDREPCFVHNGMKSRHAGSCDNSQPDRCCILDLNSTRCIRRGVRIILSSSYRPMEFGTTP